MLIASLLLPAADGQLHFGYIAFWFIAALVCLQVWVCRPLCCVCAPMSCEMRDGHAFALHP